MALEGSLQGLPRPRLSISVMMIMFQVFLLDMQHLLFALHAIRWNYAPAYFRIIKAIWLWTLTTVCTAVSHRPSQVFTVMWLCVWGRLSEIHLFFFSDLVVFCNIGWKQVCIAYARINPTFHQELLPLCGADHIVFVCLCGVNQTDLLFCCPRAFL